MTAGRPSPHELWEQANGDRDEYRRLLREHGYLLPRETASEFPEHRVCRQADEDCAGCAKKDRELGSLARRLGVRFGELEEARAALRQALDERAELEARVRAQALKQAGDEMAWGGAGLPMAPHLSYRDAQAVSYWLWDCAGLDPSVQMGRNPGAGSSVSTEARTPEGQDHG